MITRRYNPPQRFPRVVNGLGIERWVYETTQVLLNYSLIERERTLSLHLSYRLWGAFAPLSPSMPNVYSTHDLLLQGYFAHKKLPALLGPP